MQLLTLMEGAALRAGEYAYHHYGEKSGNEKGDVNVGHHAIVTETDVYAQQIALELLAQDDSEAMFLTEEKWKGDPQIASRILDSANYTTIQDFERVKIIDPLDGSSFWSRRLPGWSVSIGGMEHGEHTRGVIYAPEECGGLLVRGGANLGVRVRQEYGTRNFDGAMNHRKIKKSTVFCGLDIAFLPQYKNFVAAFAPQVQTTSSTTCALALAYVAAGRVDALVQPVQAPWDWAAGYPLVLAAGGKFQFYHYRQGHIVPLHEPDIASYDPVKRNTAFIAGRPDIVDWLFTLLQETWIESS